MDDEMYRVLKYCMVGLDKRLNDLSGFPADRIEPFKHTKIAHWHLVNELDDETRHELIGHAMSIALALVTTAQIGVDKIVLNPTKVHLN